MCWRQSLVRALNPRFALILIHSVVSRSLSLPRIGGFKFHFFQERGLLELLHRVPWWQDRFQKVKLALVKGIGELDMKFDVKVTGFVVSLGGHTLAMDDFQVTYDKILVSRMPLAAERIGLPS
jgi:hypothetical protein